VEAGGGGGAGGGWDDAPDEGDRLIAAAGRSAAATFPKTSSSKTANCKQTLNWASATLPIPDHHSSESTERRANSDALKMV
jgi:hypothetical protein